jgi:ADP-ribose pyrophosphatase YjhB (NUDIX family)
MFCVYRIRSSVSRELSEKIKIRLPEEVTLEAVMDDVAKWQAQLKRKYQVS